MQLTSPYLLVRVGEPVIVGLLIKKKKNTTRCIQLGARVDGHGGTLFSFSLQRKRHRGLEKTSVYFLSPDNSDACLFFCRPFFCSFPLLSFRLYSPLTSALLREGVRQMSHTKKKMHFFALTKRQNKTRRKKKQKTRTSTCTDATDELWRTYGTQRCRTLVF